MPFPEKQWISMDAPFKLGSCHAMLSWVTSDLHDFRQVCTGSLHLPLYHKPVDPNRMRCKRINAKTFDLHVHVSQV